MSGDPGFAALVERYQGLGTADRKAVRRNLSQSEFEALESASVEIDRARRAEQVPERQFRVYSPWLAGLIEQALGDDPRLPEVTAECRAAIASSHLSIVGDQREETLVARIARLFGNAGPDSDAAGVR